MARLNISVILCTYNRVELLDEVFENMEQLEVPVGITWELIVVDNNSSDSTRDVVMDYSRNARLPIRYIFEPQQGLSYARNRGVCEAHAPIVAFTDDDQFLDPQWLRALLRAFEQYDCAGVGGRVIATWDFPKPKWIEAPGMEKLIGGPIGFYDSGDVSRPYTCSGTDVPVGGNMAFRREVFEHCGQFRTDLGRTDKSLFSGEDSEFYRRLLDHGGKLIYCADAIVYHPVRPDRATKRYFRRWMWGSGRSRARMQPIVKQGGTLFGLPLWQYRSLMRMIVQYFRRKATLDPQRHAAELALIRQLGRIYEHLRKWYCHRQLV